MHGWGLAACPDGVDQGQAGGGGGGDMEVGCRPCPDQGVCVGGLIWGMASQGKGPWEVGGGG